MKTINNELIRSFNPCYDPSEKGIPDSETLPVRDWVKKYRAVVPAFWGFRLCFLSRDACNYAAGQFSELYDILTFND